MKKPNVTSGHADWGRRIRTLHWPLCFASLTALPVVTLFLRRVGYVRLQKWLAYASPQPRRTTGSDSRTARALEQRSARAVSIAAHRGLMTGTCLSRSLTLWWLLRWQGVRSDVQIGVRRQAGRFEAHAWLEHNGRVINDRSDVGVDFTPFDNNQLFDEQLPWDDA